MEEKRGADLTFPNRRTECKHSWMTGFIECVLIVALPFRRLPKTVMYKQNVLLTDYLLLALLCVDKVQALRSLGHLQI